MTRIKTPSWQILPSLFSWLYYFRVQKIRQACPAGGPAIGLTRELAALDGSGFGRENNTAGLFERQEKGTKVKKAINTTDAPSLT